MTDTSQPRTAAPINARTALWAAVKIGSGISLTEEQLDLAIRSFAANRWELQFEAAAQAEGSLDVDILGKAIRVVMDNVQEIGLFPEHSPEIAAEYQRLAAEKPHD